MPIRMKFSGIWIWLNIPPIVFDNKGEYLIRIIDILINLGIDCQKWIMALISESYLDELLKAVNSISMPVIGGLLCNIKTISSVLTCLAEHGGYGVCHCFNPLTLCDSEGLDRRLQREPDISCIGRKCNSLVLRANQ